MPWGTLDVTGTDVEEVPFMTPVCVLSDKNALIQFNISFWIPYIFLIYIGDDSEELYQMLLQNPSLLSQFVYYSYYVLPVLV